MFGKIWGMYTLKISHIDCKIRWRFQRKQVCLQKWGFEVCSVHVNFRGVYLDCNRHGEGATRATAPEVVSNSAWEKIKKHRQKSTGRCLLVQTGDNPFLLWPEFYLKFWEMKENQVSSNKNWSFGYLFFKLDRELDLKKCYSWNFQGLHLRNQSKLSKATGLPLVFEWQYSIFLKSKGPLLKSYQKIFSVKRRFQENTESKKLLVNSRWKQPRKLP